MLESAVLLKMYNLGEMGICEATVDGQIIDQKVVLRNVEKEFINGVFVKVFSF